MGIIKISEMMHENLRIASMAFTRSMNAQAEHWMKVGMLMEMHPDLSHRDICQLLVKASTESNEQFDGIKTLLNDGVTTRKSTNEQ
ncbi:MAG: ParD-like family protein [Ewingella sp.]|uniref:ParD-like family protein n=1 Tax=Ewingella TaxID=41201 RepID=UPI0017CE9266|nr:ParD-like family protein [Pseudomonas reactans]